MTRKQAIEELSILLNKYQDSVTGDALDVAIDALEQEPCEDCIGRAQALSDYADWYGYGYKDNTFYKHLKDMPPVNPQEPKTGHWIELDECSNSGYYCSECHKKVVKEGWSETVKTIKFCPNCGVPLEGVKYC